MSNANEAATLVSRYVKAMVAGNTDACIAIEVRYDMFGYSPEIVCIGLNAIDERRDPDAAIDAHLIGALKQEATP